MAEPLDFSAFAGNSVGKFDEPTPEPETAEKPAKLDFSEFAGESVGKFGDELAPDDSEGPGALRRGFVNSMARDNPEMLAESLEGLAVQLPDDEEYKAYKDGLMVSSRQLKDMAKAPLGKKYKLKSGNFTDLSPFDVSGALTWLGEKMGSGVASTIPTLISSFGGAYAGKKVGGKLGGRLGAVAGAAGGSYVMNYGEVYSGLKEGFSDIVGPGVKGAMKLTPLEANRKLAAEFADVFTIPIAGLDSIVPAKFIAAVGGMSNVRKAAARGLIKRILQEAGKGAGTEGLTEGSQEAIKQAAIGLLHDEKFWTWENMKNVINAGMAGSAAGVAFGGVGGLRRDRTPYDDVLDLDPADEVPTDLDPADIVTDPAALTPGESPPPKAPAATAASEPLKDGTTRTTRKPAENVPGVGNPQSAPTGSSIEYPKEPPKWPAKTPVTIDGQTTELPEGAPSFAIGNLAPEVEEAMRHAQPVKPQLPSAGDVATNVENAAASPDNRLEQDVIPPLPAGKPKTADEVVDNIEQAVAPGYTRMYHGGTEEDLTGQGPRWFSSDRNYAEGYAAMRGEGTTPAVSYVDVPSDHPLLDQSGGVPNQGIAQGFTVNTELPAEIANQRKRLGPAPVTQQVTSEPVPALDPEVATQTNRELAAFGEHKGRRVLPAAPAEAFSVDRPVIDNVKQAEEAAAPPKEKKAGHRVKAELKAREESNAAAVGVATEFQPGSDEQHLGKPGAKGVKSRAAILKRAGSIVARAKEKGVKRLGNIRDNVDETRSHSAEAILIDEARRLVALKGKKLTDDAIADFAKTEALLRSGDPNAVKEALRTRREKGDEAFRQKRIDSEKAAELAAAKGAAQAQDAGAKSEEVREDELNQEAAEGVSEGKLRKKKAIEDARQEDVSRRGTDAKPAVGSETATKATPDLYNEETAKKVTSGEKLSPVEKARMIAERNAQMAASSEPKKKPGIGEKAQQVIEKTKTKPVEKSEGPVTQGVTPKTKTEKMAAAKDLYDRGIAAAEAHKKDPSKGLDKQANVLLRRAEELYQEAEKMVEPKKAPKKAKPTPAELEAEANRLLGVQAEEDAIERQEEMERAQSVEKPQKTDESLEEMTNAIREISLIEAQPRNGERFMDFINRVKLHETTVAAMGPKLSDLFRGRLVGPMKAIWPAVWKVLQLRAGDIKVITVPHASLAAWQNNAKVGAIYQADANVIVLSESVTNTPDRLGLFAVHEVVHAAFLRAMHESPQIRKLVDEIAREARAEMVKRFGNVPSILEYAFTNADEFIAEALSNEDVMLMLAHTKASPKLMLKLAKMKMNPSLRSMDTLYDALRNVIANALGFKTNLEYSLMDGILRAASGLSEMEGSRRLALDTFPAQVRWRMDMAAAPGSPWAPVDPMQAVWASPARLDLDEMNERMGDRGEAAYGWARRNWPKFLSWTQMARQYADTYLGPHLDTIASTINSQAAVLNRYRKEYGDKAGKLVDLINSDPKMADELIDIGQAITNVGGVLVEGVAPGDILAHPANKFIGNVKNLTQAKVLVPQLQARYNAMSPRARALYQELVAFYKEKHAEIVRLSVINQLNEHDVGATLSTAEKDGIVDRVLNHKLTEADKARLGTGLYNSLSKEGDFRAQKGNYFPRLRYGDHVIVAEDPITDTMGGTKTAEDKVLFTDKSNTAAWKKAEAFAQAKDQLNLLNVRHVFIDDNTGKVVTADEAKSLNDVSHGYELTMQTKAVYMFESRTEAVRAGREMKRDGVHKTVYEVMSRIGEGYEAQLMSGTQIEAMHATINKRTDLSESQKQLLRTVVSHASARMMRGNRISSRRLKSLKVTGASRDFARNLMNYGEAAARHVVTAKTMPIVRKAQADMVKAMEGYYGDDAAQMHDVLNEVKKRIVDGRVHPGEPSTAMRDLLILSYFTRLLSPAYSLVNGLQVFMVTAPYLGGRYGYGRSMEQIYNAYADLGFGKTLGSGVKNTLSAGGQWTKNSLENITDVITEAKARLAKAPDGANLVRMLDALIEGGAITDMAGFETNEATAHGRGMWGKTLVKTDRIARMMPLAIETINRFVTATSAYRLAMETPGMTHEKAVKMAFAAVDETQGIYDDANAARFFKNPWFRPWSQFKKYAQLYTALMGSMTHTAFVKKAKTELDKQERRIAMKQLAGIVATQISMAGALSLPGLELIKAGFMIASILGFGDGWDDVEEELQQLAEDTLGKYWGELVTRGVISRAIGIDLSSRLSAADLWLFGEPDNPKDIKSVVSYIAYQATGSVGDMVFDTIEAVRYAGEFDFRKAAESIPIKALADAVKSANKGSGMGTFGLNVFGVRTAAQAEEGRAMGIRHRQKNTNNYNQQRLYKMYEEAQTAGERARIRAQIVAHNKTAPMKYRVNYRSVDRNRKEAQ